LNTMFSSKHIHYSSWVIPSAYALAATVAGVIFPRIENHLFPDMTSAVSVSAATAIYSSIASGMIALTGIVFSLTFVMVQFSSIAYSPRLVLWIARDPFMQHALGIFTATFMYAIAALAWLDRGSSTKVPFVSSWVVIVLLLVSVGMFVGLTQRVAALQVHSILRFSGDQGRRVIKTMYQLAESDVPTAASSGFRGLALTQTLLHQGEPCSIQAIEITTLVELARAADGVIEMIAAVGDTALEPTPLLHVYGAGRNIDAHALRDAITLGDQRTFDQDPKYAIRLLVDIAIKALSPAVNDPTTAVQAVDQIEDLLLRLGLCRLEIGEFHDRGGHLRLVVPFPTWEDFLRLALEEIRACGATSVQVMRRMEALASDLLLTMPKPRHEAVKQWEARLRDTVAKSFANTEDRQDASVGDRQGLGVSRPKVART
jgi:uncharacterized membrane protein